MLAKNNMINTKIRILFCIVSECPFSKRLREGISKHSSEDDVIVSLKENADPETTTPNGCKCSSTCGASLGVYNYALDWCHTEDKCGGWSFIHGYWDYCYYLDSSKPDYVAQTWVEKQEQMWAKIIADNSIAPKPNPANILFESVKTSFDDEWDIMPAG